MRLFIDDLRDPPEGEWTVVRSTAEAIALCRDGVPEFISFDHDLGGDDRAFDFVKWMIDQDLDRPGFIPATFDYTIHSANPIGADNIQALLDRYLAYRKGNP